MNAIEAYTGEVRDYPHPRSSALEIIIKDGEPLLVQNLQKLRIHRLIY